MKQSRIGKVLVLVAVYALVSPLLTGCAYWLRPKPGDRVPEYERRLLAIFSRNGLPKTDVKVTRVGTPNDAQRIVALLVDDAILYDKDLHGAVIYGKPGDFPQFTKAQRDEAVSHLLGAQVFQVGDELVRIEIEPAGMPMRHMYGLISADGAPKFDALSARELSGLDRGATATHGSWRLERTKTWLSPLDNPVVTHGFDAKLTTVQCRAVDTKVVKVETLHRTFAAESKCLEPAYYKWCRPNPDCQAGGDCDQRGEDCRTFVTRCAVVAGITASGDIKIDLSAGVDTEISVDINSQRIPVKVHGRISVDEDFFSKKYPEKDFVGSLCACIGNPDARRQSPDGSQQFENVPFGGSTATEEFNPRESHRGCGLSPVGSTSVPHEESDVPPSSTTPLGGTGH